LSSRQAVDECGAASQSSRVRGEVPLCQVDHRYRAAVRAQVAFAGVHRQLNAGRRVPSAKLTGSELKACSISARGRRTNSHASRSQLPRRQERTGALRHHANPCVFQQLQTALMDLSAIVFPQDLNRGVHAAPTCAGCSGGSRIPFRPPRGCAAVHVAVGFQWLWMMVLQDPLDLLPGQAHGILIAPWRLGWLASSEYAMPPQSGAGVRMLEIVAPWANRADDVERQRARARIQAPALVSTR